MSEISFSPLFIPESPYDSIISFMNTQNKLPTETRTLFLTKAMECFSALAFEDRLIGIPTSLTQRFCKIDLPNILTVMTQIEMENAKEKYRQLIANISKVTPEIFSLLNKEDRVYLIRSLNPSCSGWIREEYVLSSKKLREYIHSNDLLLFCIGIKPSALLALQRVQCLDLRNESVDISIESLVDLLIFAKEWEVELLEKDVMFLLNAIKQNCVDRLELEEIIEGLQPSDKKMVKLALKEDASQEFSQKPYKATARHEVEKGDSRWFNREKPFLSMMQFTRKCCTLPREEQHRFFSSVKDFFVLADSSKLGVSVPSEFKDRFALVDLPFLLATMHHPSTDEKQQLAATIQQVTMISFHYPKIILDFF